MIRRRGTPETQLFLAGFPKCGSSSLFDLLARHPSVTPSFRKETWALYPAIWERRSASDRELNAVESVFAHDPGQIAMEGSPCTVFASPELIGQLKRRGGNTKILAVIRDPIDRLRSAYEFSMSLGSLEPTTSFSDFVAWNIDGFARKPSFRPGVAPAFHLWSSDFAAHLEPWVEAFGSDVGVGDISGFANEQTRCELAGWLGITAHGLGDLPRSNVTPSSHGGEHLRSSSAQDLLPAARGLASELEEITADITERLVALMNRSTLTTFDKKT